MFYKDEIENLLSQGKSKEEIINYFNIPIINNKYIKMIEAYNATYTRAYKHQVVSHTQGPQKASRNRKILEIIIERFGGITAFKKATAGMKLYEIAKLLDLPYYHVKDCLKYWMKEQNHYRPKVLRNYKSFENIDKQPNKKPSRKLKRLYKLF